MPLTVLAGCHALLNLPSLHCPSQVSPDGLLLQSSTVSDKVPYKFADGSVHDIAGSYIEFAERRPLKVRS